jgi:hypothetical protein
MSSGLPGHGVQLLLELLHVAGGDGQAGHSGPDQRRRQGVGNRRVCERQI